jgi:hypothetical protein
MSQTYAEALASGRKTGASRCTDQEATAMLLDGCAQILLGAVSPKLIWQGAMSRGMTQLEVAALIHDDPQAACDLMWEG